MAKEWALWFYKSKEWQTVRSGYIAFRRACDGGMCEFCRESPGYIVHHIIELTPENIVNPNVSLDYNNLQFVCKTCHDKIHNYCGKYNRPAREVQFDSLGNPMLKSDG